jgi:hypothetical protein
MDSKPHEVWPFRGHPGFLRSMEGAGTVAAPLLAGFSFTLLALVVPTVGTERTVIAGGSGIRVVREHEAFSAEPTLAALLLLLAGLLLVFSVQAAIFVGYHRLSPSTLEEWYPQYFRQAPAEHPDRADVPADLKNWDHPDVPATRVGTRWFAGAMRRYLYIELENANRWASATRNLYHFGILSLLSGLTDPVWPPVGQDRGVRVALVALAVAGTAVEAVWILVASRETLHGWFARMRCRPRRSPIPAATQGSSSHQRQAP